MGGLLSSCGALNLCEDRSRMFVIDKDTHGSSGNIAFLDINPKSKNYLVKDQIYNLPKGGYGPVVELERQSKWIIKGVQVPFMVMSYNRAAKKLEHFGNLAKVIWSEKPLYSLNMAKFNNNSLIMSSSDQITIIKLRK